MNGSPILVSLGFDVCWKKCMEPLDLGFYLTDGWLGEKKWLVVFRSLSEGRHLE